MHDKNKLKIWFELFETKCEKFDIELKNIYNMNEKNYALNLIKIIKIVTCIKKQRNASTFLMQYNNREWIYLIECISTNDRKFESWIIFKEKMQQK